MAPVKSGQTQVRIIEAAVRLFAEQGFSATSTRDIARLADVNETSLFRYFPRKQELFWAAVRSRLERVRLSRELETALGSNDDPEVVVPLIVEFFVRTVAFEPELIRLLRFGLLELGPLADRVCRQHFAPIFRAISDYLGRCISEGILRKGVDPALTTVSLGMTVLSHAETLRVVVDSCVPYRNSAEAVSAYSNFWLSALMSHANTAAVRPAHPETGEPLRSSATSVSQVSAGCASGDDDDKANAIQPATPSR